MRRVLPLLLFIGCAGPTQAPSSVSPLLGVPPMAALRPLVTDFDVEHYRLDLRLEPTTRRLDGTCRVRLFPLVDVLRTVNLDLVGLEVSSVTDSRGRELAFVHLEGRLRIELGEPAPRGKPLELSVEYGGTPRVGLYFVGGEPATHVFTQGRCEDARGWFPCQDHPSDRATSEIWVDLPAGWSAVAAGERVEAREVGGRRLEGWRMHAPHPAYLTSLVAGELASMATEWDGVPISFHAPAAFEARLTENLGVTDDALGFLSELTGRRYPYAKYATSCVEDFPSGGMENVSATTLGLTALRDAVGRADRSADGLVVHEAAHQWFGDLLTCAEWSEAWLNEGFATYCTGLWVEKTDGAEHFQLWIDEAINSYLEEYAEHPRALVHALCREPIDLFSDHVYAGGAVRLHLLRKMLGDEAFYAGIRRYVGENAGRSVTTADLRGAMERASGEDLSEFFEQWVLRPGHPELEVSWLHDKERGRILLSLNQVHSLEGGVTAAFSFPLEVEIATSEGVQRHSIAVQERRALFEFEVQGRPRWVLIDPDRWVPLRMSSRKDMEEWSSILTAAGPVARRRAVRALARLAHQAEGDRRDSLSGLLVERLKVDEREEVRVDLAKSLGEVGGELAREALLSAARVDPSPSVRVGALTSLRAVGEDAELATLAQELVTAAMSWEVVAQAARLLESADPLGAEAWLRQRLEGSNPTLLGQPHVSLLPALVDAAGVRAAAVLLQLAVDSRTPTPLRVVATRELGRLAAGDPTQVPALGRLLSSDSARVRTTAVEALAAVDEPGARQLLVTYYPQSGSAGERRRIEVVFGL